jgi:4-hydroxy-tetrahydrodipicolinate reductase
MGSGMARLMLEKSGLQIVAAVDARPDYVGRDLGEVLGVGKKLGVTVTDHPETVLDSNKVDLTVIATTSWTERQMPDLRKIITAGINVISIAEEMADPAAQHPELAKELDGLAKQHGVSVLGTGVNPGYVLDLLVVALTGGCHSVERIEASRVQRSQPYGPTVMETQGVGTTPEVFRKGVEEAHCRACRLSRIHPADQRCTGVGVDRIVQNPRALHQQSVTARRRTSRWNGLVAGCAHTALAYAATRKSSA